MMKKICLVLALVMILTVALVGCGGNETPAETPTPVEDMSLESVTEKGYYILGLDDSFPPMGFRDRDGEVVGFDIDLANEVAARLGVELQIQPIDWDSKSMELNSGNIDVIWNGLTITEERKEVIGFSKPYLNNNQIIIVREDSAIDTKADLAEKNVGVQLDSSSQHALEADEATASTLAEIVKFGNNQEAIMDLGIGRIDAIVVDEILGRYIISQRPGEFKVASENFGSEQYGIGFRKGEDKFIEAVNNALAEMTEDGTTAEISTKWFGEDIFVK